MWRMMALEWTYIELNKRQLCVARSGWKGHVTAPKGGPRIRAKAGGGGGNVRPFLLIALRWALVQPSAERPLTQGILPAKWLAMSEPCGSPLAKRKVSRMVEAAGVEPASENTSSQSTTCVSPFSCRDRLETEPSAPAAIPDMSHRHASGRNVAASPLNDDQSRAVGTLKLIAHRLLSGESVVCVRSYVVFPRVLRGAWASARVPRSRTPVEARSPPE